MKKIDFDTIKATSNGYCLYHLKKNVKTHGVTPTIVAFHSITLMKHNLEPCFLVFFSL